MADSPDKTGRKQDGTFQKGTSGNPKGRPKGRMNKLTLALQSLMEGEAEEIAKTVIDLAKSGDLTAAKMVLDRACPAPKELPVSLPLPVIENPKDLIVGMNAIQKSLSVGDITPKQALELMGFMQGYRKIFEAVEIEGRLAAIEKKMDYLKGRK